MEQIAINYHAIKFTVDNMKNRKDLPINFNVEGFLETLDEFLKQVNEKLKFEEF